MIPKIIHYCWVGGAEKPQSVLYCIESWKKYCPDYQIIEWNESNYDFSKNEYMKEAYEAKKWGFVPDYARLDIVYEYGGIYLDTDVEIKKSFDSLLEENAFMGFENTGDGEFFVNCGHGFGAEPHHFIIKAARDMYDTMHFRNGDGSLNMLASPHYTTEALVNFGLVQNNTDQTLPQMKIFASDVLCPKNFRTGVISETERTVSIHHFTASWLDEKIRKELEYQQEINRKYGKKLGHYVMLMDSVKEKYNNESLFSVLPKVAIKKCKGKLVVLHDELPYQVGLIKAKFVKNGKNDPVILDTAMQSDNCGDQIIMENCIKALNKIENIDHWKHVPTHREADETEKQVLKNAKFKIVCGTNLLSGNMKYYKLWKTGSDISIYKNTVLMGVGFDSESTDFDEYTRKMLHLILNKDYLHCVRDTFSEKKLKNMGIENVIYTGCPTMWSLTPEVCAAIPHTKGKNVVCTLTDYNRDSISDSIILNILLALYEKVWFWVQGKDDMEYLKELGMESKVKIIDNSLAAYDEILKLDELDYVGTRLHAGIRAISTGHRTIIISIDNRAKCIAEDTGLTILGRDVVKNELEKKITSDFETSIKMPWNAIDQWKGQFIGR